MSSPPQGSASPDPTTARYAWDLAARQHRTLFVDETFLYDPLVQRAREWIAAGRLGRLLHLSFERLGMGRIRRDSDVWWNSAPHDVSILRYFVPEEVERVRVDTFTYLQPGVADMCVGTVRFVSGVSTTRISTASWRTTGPESIPSSTKWTVTPVTLTPWSKA